MNEISIATAVASLTGAFITLGILAYIDLKIRLLPNIYVATFAVFGILFHSVTGFSYTSVPAIFAGILTGGGLLYAVRFISNRLYGQDTLGLGDVKLMMAAGLWLGGESVLLAIILGAGAGIIHGLGMALAKWKKTGKPVNLSRLSLPAGPGFIVGIIIAGMLKFLA